MEVKMKMNETMHEGLLAKKTVDCPCCEKEHEIEIRKRNAYVAIKGQRVLAPETYYYCAESNSEYVPGGIMDENLLAARDAYRQQSGLLTSRDIAAIRSELKLSQKDFSLLLGFGEITVTRYETVQIQDPVFDEKMRQAQLDSEFLLNQLEKNRSSFSTDKFHDLKARIFARLTSRPVSEMYRKGLISQYLFYDEPDDYNGNTTLDIDKISAMVVWFAAKIAGLAKVKLMKLMWYADALAFSRRKKAISGLVYRHFAYGALPIGADELIRIAPVVINEIETADYVSILIQPRSDRVWKECLLSLEPDEMAILQEIKTLLGTYSGPQLSAIMHEEVAYQQTRQYDIIPFSLASDLKAFRPDETNQTR